MKALDTNVLVRFLVADDAAQSAAAKRLLTGAETAGERCFVTDLVVLETLWVLGSVYDHPRQDILSAFESLAQLSSLEFESPDRLHGLLRAGASGKVGLADLWIGLAAKAAGCDSTLTFDRKAVQSPLFELVAV